MIEARGVDVRLAKLLVVEAHLRKMAERSAAIEQELLVIARIVREMVEGAEK